jgi:hypothetical protein
MSLPSTEICNDGWATTARPSRPWPTYVDPVDGSGWHIGHIWLPRADEADQATAHQLDFEGSSNTRMLGKAG